MMTFLVIALGVFLAVAIAMDDDDFTGPDAAPAGCMHPWP